MNISIESITLHLKQPFATSHFRSEESESLIISIEHEGIRGLGEVKSTADACGGRNQPVGRFIEEIEAILGNNPFDLEKTLARVQRQFGGASCILAGIDMALHDLCGKLLGVPLYKWLGLNPHHLPQNSFTIGVSDTSDMIERARSVSDYPILKIKAGTPDDVEVVRLIRRETNAVLRVDANGGWSSVEEAVERIDQMTECGIELVEQPLPRGRLEETKQVRQHVNVPVFVDEDVRTSVEIPPLIGCVDGINIKLMECGGIREAVRMIHVARTFGLKVMLGCMIESSLSLTAAAHLTPLADYADLDAHLLLEDDPFEGFDSDCGKIKLTARNGLGVISRAGV